MTEATVGMLTQLRIKSREERINLLFIAYKERVVNAVIAQKIAQDLGINTSQAPWNTGAQSASTSLHSSSSLSSEVGSISHSLTEQDHTPNEVSRPMSNRPSRRFAERASLTEAIQSANQNANRDPLITPSIPSSSPKRSFAAQDLKTEIEINLPSLMEEMQRSSTPSSKSSSPSSVVKHQPDSNPETRWSSLALIEQRLHLGQSIYKYLITDQLLNRSVHLLCSSELTSMSQAVAPNSARGSILLSAFLRSQELNNQTPKVINVHRHISHEFLIIQRELPRGQCLTSLETKDPLPSQPLLRDLCLHLKTAHQSGIAHRAIRASSIYINQNSSYIEDWAWCCSIARSAYPQTLPLKSLSVDERWVAPEVKRTPARIQGAAWISADIYSMATLAVWIYAREVPPNMVTESTSALREWLYEALSHHVSPHYINACHRALSAKPTLRPQSIDLLYQQLFDEPLVT